MVASGELALRVRMVDGVDELLRLEGSWHGGLSLKKGIGKLKRMGDASDKDLLAFKNLYIVLPGRYHTISHRYTQTPIASTRWPSHPKLKRE